MRIVSSESQVFWPLDEGVLGVVGVAPWATLEFCRELYRQVLARKDWEYPQVLLDINTKIPSRGRHLALGETDPSPMIAQTIRELADRGATIAVVVCNTAHILYERWSRNLPIPVLNIVDETVAAAVDIKPVRIATLSSGAVAESNLYDAAVKRAGIAIHRIEEEQQILVNHLIARIKIHGSLSIIERNALRQLGTDLRSAGVDVAIVGCTELSLLHEDLTASGLTVVDSNGALARAALRSLKIGVPLVD